MKQDSILKLLWQDGRSRFGVVVIALAVLVAMLGAYIRPDASKNANEQHLELAKKKPGFEVQMIKVHKNEQVSNNWLGGLFFGGIDNKYHHIPIESYRVLGDKLIYTPYDDDQEKELLLADILFPLGAESYSLNSENTTFTFEGNTQEIAINKLQNQVAGNIVTRKYWLGTDTYGRDLLSRLMGGVIISLSVGFISVLISLFIGITLGALAGYYGGWLDKLIMWLVNVIWSIPTLLMVIAITLVMGKGFVQVFIAVGITMWVEVARVVRGQILGVKKMEYIEATRSLGYSDFKIITKHILPNIMGPVIVISAANFASAILIEAGLSFLGIGTQIPTPSWGSMIKEHYPYITTDLAYLAVVPGVCIMLLVLSLMLIGNRLRDIYDVKS